MNKKAISKIIILDRDGIINHDSKHYIKTIDEFILIQGSIDAIARLTKAGFRIGVATNQSGVARGYYTEQTLKAIHTYMLNLITNAGGFIEEIAYCPHLPEEKCGCRKPSPGMLINLAKRFATEPDKMIFVGDKITDIKAAIAVGATPLLVYSEMTDKEELKEYKSIKTFSSLAKCADYLLNEQG
jgi:D-glycero-D-manno-heptose 1,7-bisphosphate phosphatase